MLIDKKSEIETVIIEKYLNKDINLLEKEMAINVLLEICYGEDVDEDDIRVFKVIREQPINCIVDWIIDFGRDNYSSHEITNPTYIDFSVNFLIKEREKYINV
jgi:hypothetical protein